MAKKGSEGGRRGRRAPTGGGRNDQVVRILRLLSAIENRGGMDLYELATHFGRSARTIRRDIEALEEAGIPIRREAAEDSSRVRYYFDSKATPAAATLLDASHFLALKMAMTEGAVSKANAPVMHSLEKLCDAIEQAIGEKGRAQLQRIDSCFFSWDKFNWRKTPGDRLLPLIEAIAAQLVCEVHYRTPSVDQKEKTYRVLPLKLFVYNGTLYLHAWNEKHRRVLVLNVNRLQALKVSSEKAAPPSSYEPERLEASAFGIFIGPDPVRFVLDFDAFARPFIEEREWHPSQCLEAGPNGGVRLSFTCAPSYEVTNWVSSWAQHVEVVAPRTLRDELGTFGRWLTERYPNA